jgi:hypothetical protein
VGDAWVGAYRAPDGRVAIVTTDGATRGRALEAAVRWVRSGEPAGAAAGTYVWMKSQRYPGRFEVFWDSRLGPRPVPLEPA